MKNVLLAIFSLLIISAAAQKPISTGDAHLDSDLNAITDAALLDYENFQSNMITSYDIMEGDIYEMKNTLDLSPGEIYLTLEVSSLSGTSVEDILKIYEENKEKGWGFIIKKAGIKPGSDEFHELKNNAKSNNGKGKK